MPLPRPRAVATDRRIDSARIAENASTYPFAAASACSSVTPRDTIRTVWLPLSASTSTSGLNPIASATAASVSSDRSRCTSAVNVRSRGSSRTSVAASGPDSSAAATRIVRTAAGSGALTTATAAASRPGRRSERTTIVGGWWRTCGGRVRRRGALVSYFPARRCLSGAGWSVSLSHVPAVCARRGAHAERAHDGDDTDEDDQVERAQWPGQHRIEDRC